MKINISYLCSAVFNSKDQFLSSLTPLNKKILVVAAIAFSCLAALFFLDRFCKGYFSAKNNENQEGSPIISPKIDKKEQKQTADQKILVTPPKPTPSANPLIPKPVYDSTKNRFEGIHPQAEELAEQLKTVLKPEVAVGLNIERVARFGDWQEMGYEAQKPLVRQGKEFKLIESIAAAMPELGHYVFLNVRGNGECGYRSLANGVIYGDCILNDDVEGLKQTLQTAFDQLIESWNTLPFSPKERNRFKASHEEALIHLDQMKKLTSEGRMALLQDEAFLAPFLTLIRCIVVSQTKCIESEKVDDKIHANVKQTNDILESFKAKLQISEAEEELLSYALANYSLDALLGDAELIDKYGNEKQNKMKGEIKGIVRRAYQADEKLLAQLKDLLSRRDELSNKENILATPLPEYLEMGIDFDEFLKRKALGHAESPRSLWALGSDFTALGYALNKNICCIMRDAFKDNVFDVVQTYPERPPYFYGLNLTSQAHYNALLPLV